MESNPWCMWPIIRHIGLIDMIVSVCYIVYVSLTIYKTDGTLRNSNEDLGRGVYQKQFVFFLLEHFLLVLRLISAVVLFGTSFKDEFRRHFNACILWSFIALITIITLTFQLIICQMELVKILISTLDIILRIICAIFVINYMRNEKQ